MEIVDLFAVPQHRAAAAALIHREFWTDVPGASVERMAARLAEAADASRVPLALGALQGDTLVGAVNLVDNDAEAHPEWAPWLAGMVVAPACRGRGIGTLLVGALLQRAWRIGVGCVYLGTDGPGFYTRLGAVVQAQPRPDFWYLRFDEPLRTR